MVARMTSRAGAAPVALAVLLMLAGCGGAPAIGDGSSAGADEEGAVLLPFLTNRAIEAGSDGKRRYGNTLGALSGGRCTVVLGEGLRDARVAAVSERPLPAVLESLTDRGGRPVVVYFHGYYEDFERSCRRAAVFRERLGLTGGFLLFSWPANSTPVTYGADVRDLEASVPVFAEALASIADRFGRGNISIVAHSLGSRGLVSALQQAPVSDVRFRDLLLLAADIGRSRFLEALPALRARVGQLTVLVSGRDRALRLSEAVNRAPRLGQSRDLSAPGIEIRDMSEIADAHLSGHLYHLRNERAVDIIREVLFRPTGADRKPVQKAPWAQGHRGTARCKRRQRARRTRS